MLKLANIETYYRLTNAVRGVSLEVAEGQIVTLLGANGAGKSSTLRTIMGLIDDQPEKGTIEFNGRRLNGLDPEDVVRMGIAYVPEGRAVFPELSVAENLLMGAYTRRDRAAAARDLDAVHAYFPVLKTRKDQLAGTLSGGEQQMLAIGRALMSKPSLMLLDEPSLGLSPILVKEIYGIIRAIHKAGTAILLVEQNAKMALDVADYAYVMETGRIVRADTPAILKDDPDIREFYLGAGREDTTAAPKRYRRKKRWR
ncbi:MAG: ABC transporter ATP-binding protein [Deltaproteobacteria bacterium]|nr:ABC transporter ATP-binding protein [Deltaproteobacteria bacterium]